MDKKIMHAENLMQEICRIDAGLADLEMDLREHPETNIYGHKAEMEAKISEQIRRTYGALRELNEEVNRLMVYVGTNVGTYRKIATVKAECFMPIDNARLDYYRAKYGITKIGDLSEISSFKPTAGTQVCYMGDDSYVITTLEGNMIINNGDWILTGVDGEHWAVKDEIFNKTYKKVDD